MEKRIYPIAPWAITETEFSIETNYRNETTFALSNGYIGTRGTFEEGYPFSVDEGLEGNFINGFYESEHIRYGEWNYGFPQNSQSLLNLPNLKKTVIVIGGEPFSMSMGEVLEYSRSLNMRDGNVTRIVKWRSAKGHEVNLEFIRLVSLHRKNIMAIQIKVEPVNFSGTIRIVSYMDASVENHTRKTNPLVDYGPFGPHLIKENIICENEMMFYQGKTKNSNLAMACGSSHHITIRRKKEEIKTVLVSAREVQELGCVLTFDADVQAGEVMTIEKYIGYTSCLDMPPQEMIPFLKEQLEKAKTDGFRAIQNEQLQEMEQFWAKADIVVKGDDALQQGMRFNLFHIMQAAGRDGKTGMGAKGLTGEGYEGHYFWDTEMYVIPVFIFTQSELAKSLLHYRYSTLDQARERARVLGHVKGALYPWRTINGEEASTYFPLGTAQYHINADIAYAFKLYLDVTNDEQFLIDEACEVLVETARVWADVGCFVKSKGDKYCICAVTGPDEYNAIVDNNFYTNLMARENLRDAIHALERVKQIAPEKYRDLCERLHLEEDEVPYWQRIVNNMYFPYDEERRIYPQDDGFMMRKPWDESKIPVEKRHLLYENYHPLFIYRQKMSKQADAILGMQLYSNYFDKEELKRNYDFYQEVTLHHSSLSTSIFGMLASRIGYDEEAYRYFAESARMDLDDHHNNFYAGIHAANMAGTWQSIVFGFAGVRTNAGELEFAPRLPKEWESVTFHIRYRGSDLQICMEQNKVSFTLLNDVAISFVLQEHKVNLTKKGESYEEAV